MARRRRGSSILGLTLLAGLAACGRLGGGPGVPDADKPLRLRFEDRPEPGIFEREGPAVRDKPKGSPGLWAAVVGLPRAEHGRVVNTASGAKVDVALFVAPAGASPDIRLSNEAADVLGIGDDPAAVSVTVLRKQPEIDTTKGRF